MGSSGSLRLCARRPKSLGWRTPGAGIAQDVVQILYGSVCRARHFVPNQHRRTPEKRYKILSLAHSLLTGSEPLRLNHHRLAANDGGDASTRIGTDYHSNNIGDSSWDNSSADNNPRSIRDKGCNKRARQIYQGIRPPSLVEARERQGQALTELGEDIFS
jgi:hypothetical protein